MTLTIEVKPLGIDAIGGNRRRWASIFRKARAE
jgi:hypothetical protein